MASKHWFREPDIQDALLTFNVGKFQWFGRKDPKKEMVYSNIKLNDDTATMPTESAVNSKLAELKAEYDLQNATWNLNRKKAYGDIEEQLDMMYWDNVNSTTTWKDHVAKVKSDNPKS